VKLRCKPGEHADRPLRGGKRVRCTKCGDEFPCAHDCSHADCAIAAGRALPDWITVHEAKGDLS
jgi:hypothetical protein